MNSRNGAAKSKKQGRNVHGIISLLGACSDHNNYSIKDVCPRWGACLLRSAQAAPPLFLIECGADCWLGLTK